jgi:glycosyltransferase involved in cell wall biosynthesis
MYSNFQKSITSNPWLTLKSHDSADHIPFIFSLLNTQKPSIIVYTGSSNYDLYFAVCEIIKYKRLSTRCFYIDYIDDDDMTNKTPPAFKKAMTVNDENYIDFSCLMRSKINDIKSCFSSRSVDMLLLDSTSPKDVIERHYKAWNEKLSEKCIVLFFPFLNENVRTGTYLFFRKIKLKHPHLEFHHGKGMGALSFGNDISAHFAHMVQSYRSCASLPATYAQSGKLIRLKQENDIQKQRMDELFQRRNDRLFRLNNLFQATMNLWIKKITFPMRKLSRTLKKIFRTDPHPHFNYLKFLNKPLKVMFLSHNLSLDGAPKVLLSIVTGLQEHHKISPEVASLFDGELADDFQGMNIPCQIFGTSRLRENYIPLESEALKVRKNYFKELIEKDRPDVVFANTIECCYGVTASHELMIPCVWMIHESSNYHFNQLPSNQPWPSEIPLAFHHASRVIFCSERTMRSYEKFDYNKRFSIIYNTVETKVKDYDEIIRKRIACRTDLNVPDNTIVLLNVGSMCENKNQVLILRAMQHLKEKNLKLYLVGTRPGLPYQDEICQCIMSSNLQKRVVLIPSEDDIEKYYLAADIFLLCSRTESYPLVILEAMSYGLAIISTPVFGVNEQVRFGVNALAVSPDNELDLVEKIRILTDDEVKRKSMGKNSRLLFEMMPGLDKMVDAHAAILSSAWFSYTGQKEKREK